MERERMLMIKALLRRLGRRRRRRQQLYTDAGILEVYFWACINDRPVYWACDPANWPPGLRRGPLPSQSVMSRRMRTLSVRRLLARLESLMIPRTERPELACIMDGKALVVARHSADRDAGFGRGVGNKAKGYKLHAVVDLAGRLLRWALAPLNVDERVVAEVLIRRLPPCWYLLADAHYDSNKLFACAARRGIQLLAPRRYGSDKGLGRRKHHPARLHSKHLLEDSPLPFGPMLMRRRPGVERFFANLTNFAGGLTHLPPWIRTHKRVLTWVQAKLIIAHLPRPHARLVAA